MNADSIIHLAIPCHDVEQARFFYVDILNMSQGRIYDDRVSVNFFGAQLVCHLVSEVEPAQNAYPRHFGLTYTDEKKFDAFYEYLKGQSSVRFFSDLSIRFEGKPEAHKTFFILDPSENVLEFKYYFDQSQNY